MREAMSIVEREGIAALSLRAVARRLGVSHQAPYKIYPSREHLIAEMAARSFDRFAEYLESRPVEDDARVDMRGLGERYLRYAAQHALEYQLMFGTALPATEMHPGMARSARHAFAILRGCIFREAAARSQPLTREEVDLDAMFVWSLMHGLAEIVQTSACQTLRFSKSFETRAREHALSRIEDALTSPRRTK